MSDYIYGLLLIPVFFGMGWVAARVDIKQLLHESRSLPRSYFRGLNFLLNEQPDRAVEAFQEAVKVEDQTVELHFALGSLFRRRGEVERAIRIHKNLIDREDLSQDLRLQALYELGEDFEKSGLLDRAEDSFDKLLGTALEAEAKRKLLVIYQQEKNWHKAIAIARELSDLDSSRNIAEYYCELAVNEMTYSRAEAAQYFLASALSENKKCVRATILEGDLALQAGQIEQAISAWGRIEQQSPAYLSLVAQRLMEAYRTLEKHEVGINLLRSFLERYSSLALLEAVYQLIFEIEGEEAAYRLVQDELHRNPTLLGLEKLLVARVAILPAESRSAEDLALTIVRNYTSRFARYRCENCGFKARQFYWCCPACNQWETYPPRRAEEFDLTS